MSSSKPLCLCGCEERTNGGTFRQGHDAKYKSWLINEALDGNNPEAIAILEQRGWTKFLDKRKEVLARPPKEARPKKELNMRAAEVLQLMKAAAKVLKWTGQYRRGTAFYISITPESALAIATRTHPELRLRVDTALEPFTDQEQAAVESALACLGATC